MKHILAVALGVVLFLLPHTALTAEDTGFLPKISNPLASEKAPKGSGYVALTFDDGPNPPVLLGFDRQTKRPLRFPGLLDLLDLYGVKATFFVMGWRLVPPAPAEMRQAAEEVNARGHQVENHTFGHGPFHEMARRHGEAWVLEDIEKASRVIEGLTGRRPYYLRPPEWSIWPEMKAKIEARGYRVTARVSDGVGIPPLLADVDSEDYRHYEVDPAKRPRCNLKDCVKEKIKERERRGLRGHLLVFHELPLSTEALEDLIPWLTKRGYMFVTLGEYMSIAANGGMD